MDTNRRNRKISKVPEEISVPKSDNDTEINDENVLKSSLVDNTEEDPPLEEPSDSTKNDIEDNSSLDPQNVESFPSKSESEANI